MSLPQPAWLRKTRPCPFYSQGKCLFADSCNFLHDVKVKSPVDITFAVANSRYVTPSSPPRPSPIPVVVVNSPRSSRSSSNARSPRLSGLLLALKDVIDPDEEEVSPEDSSAGISFDNIEAASFTFIGDRANESLTGTDLEDPYRLDIDESFRSSSRASSRSIGSSNWNDASDVLDELIGDHYDSEDEEETTVRANLPAENVGGLDILASSTNSHISNLSLKDDPHLSGDEESTSDLLSPVSMDGVLRRFSVQKEYDKPAQREDSIDSGYADSWSGPSPFLRSPPRPMSVLDFVMDDQDPLVSSAKGRQTLYDVQSFRSSLDVTLPVSLEPLTVSDSIDRRSTELHEEHVGVTAPQFSSISPRTPSRDNSARVSLQSLPAHELMAVYLGRELSPKSFSPENDVDYVTSISSPTYTINAHPPERGPSLMYISPAFDISNQTLGDDRVDCHRIDSANIQRDSVHDWEPHSEVNHDEVDEDSLSVQSSGSQQRKDDNFVFPAPSANRDRANSFFSQEEFHLPSDLHVRESFSHQNFSPIESSPRRTISDPLSNISSTSNFSAVSSFSGVLQDDSTSLSSNAIQKQADFSEAGTAPNQIYSCMHAQPDLASGRSSILQLDDDVTPHPSTRQLSSATKYTLDPPSSAQIVMEGGVPEVAQHDVMGVIDSGKSSETFAAHSFAGPSTTMTLVPMDNDYNLDTQSKSVSPPSFWTRITSLGQLSTVHHPFDSAHELAETSPVQRNVPENVDPESIPAMIQSGSTIELSHRFFPSNTTAEFEASPSVDSLQNELSVTLRDRLHIHTNLVETQLPELEPQEPEPETVYTDMSVSTPYSPVASRLKPLRLSSVLSTTPSSFISSSRTSSIKSSSNSFPHSSGSQSPSVTSEQSTLSNALLSSAYSSPIPQHTEHTHIHSAAILSQDISNQSLHLPLIYPNAHPRSAPLIRPLTWRFSHYRKSPKQANVFNRHPRTSSRASTASGLLYHAEESDEGNGEDYATEPASRLASILSSPIHALATPKPDLLFAIAADDVKQVKQVLENGDADPNQHVGPQSALAFTLTNEKLNNKMEIVKTLLAYGADPSVLRNPSLNPPHHGAKKDDDVTTPSASPPPLPTTMEGMDPATRYYVARADSAVTRRTSRLIHRSFFRPLTRIRYTVIGQDRALEQLFRVLSVHSQQVSAPPIVVLLCGPSGHGKSLLARKFGALLGVPTHTVNMTTLRSTHDLWRSYSMSPYEEPSSSTLTQFLLDNEGKRCVVVLDEIEKTEDEKYLWSLLMPWELGRCSIEAGQRHVDVRNVVWLGTSNIGHDLVFHFNESREDPAGQMTQEEYAKLTELLRPRVSERLGASLLSRVTTVLPFVPFSKDEQEAIAAEAVYSLSGSTPNTLSSQEIESFVGKALEAYLPAEGARSLYRAVSAQLVDMM